ncbi:MAG: phosphonate ABC transporter ATP-binding protein [Planctomycetes bacterium]|nr:phosphonate ABC transporter ATP-binding protein [Planctomycetota bacterium]
MLNFNQCGKTFADGTVALRDVSLEVPRGQFCVLLGPSGAGKTTLLRAVNGLTSLTTGDVELDGVALNRHTLGKIRRRVAMVHQQFNLVGRLNVMENVLSGSLGDVPAWRALTGLFDSRLRRKVCGLLQDVGLAESHVYKRASELSGGQQQRVAIARAFIMEPVLVLADEPVASLDMSISATILELLRDASAKRNTTVLCTLHQVELARQFADRVIGMRDGTVVYDGPPSGLCGEALDLIYDKRAEVEISSRRTAVDVLAPNAIAV